MPVNVLVQVRLFGCGPGTLVRAPLVVVDGRQEHGRRLLSLALAKDQLSPECPTRPARLLKLCVRQKYSQSL